MKGVLSFFAQEKISLATENWKRVEEYAHLTESLNQNLKTVRKKCLSYQKVELGRIEAETSLLGDSMMELSRIFKTAYDDPLSIFLGECVMGFAELHRSLGDIDTTLESSFEKGVLKSVDNYLAEMSRAKELLKEHQKVIEAYGAARSKTNKERSAKKQNPLKVVEAEREEATAKEVLEGSEREVIKNIQKILSKNNQEMLGFIATYMASLRDYFNAGIDKVQNLKAQLHEKVNYEGQEESGPEEEEEEEEEKEEEEDHQDLPPKAAPAQKQQQQPSASPSATRTTTPIASPARNRNVASSSEDKSDSPDVGAMSSADSPQAPQQTQKAPTEASVPSSSSSSSASSPPALAISEYKWDNGDRYVGQFKGKFQHGQGTLFYASGNKYEGEWKDGLRHGHGVYTFANGDKYEGEYSENKKHGYGVFTFHTGEKYEGMWYKDKQEGKGKYTYSSGNVYDGEWVNDERSGTGTYISKNGDRYEGKWRNNKKHGKGQMLYADGDSVAQWYDNGKLIKEEGDSDDDYTDSD